MPNDEKVMLGHGSGGSMMKRIIEEVFFEEYGTSELDRGDDAAVLDLLGASDGAGEAAGVCGAEGADGVGGADGAGAGAVDAATGASDSMGSDAAIRAVCKGAPRLAFSTDSFVVTPHFFPGGDIGRLAVCGTVNDVATSGAVPKVLSLGMILEEGFPMEDLRRICQSINEAASEAGVRVVTGDTKVVNRGHGDGIFINTSGIGVLSPGIDLGGAKCRPGDKVMVSGTLGDHGITIMSCREGLNFQADIQSDAAPLNHMIAAVIEAAPSTRCFRDPTRGGLASTLNELAEQSGVDFEIEEDAVPVKPQVRGACEMLGYDVMQVANEGKMVCVVGAEDADAALDAMRASKYGNDAAIIGEVAECTSADRGPKVFLRTSFGGRRILDMLVGEQLPRIC